MERGRRSLNFLQGRTETESFEGCGAELAVLAAAAGGATSPPAPFGFVLAAGADVIAPLAAADDRIEVVDFTGADSFFFLDLLLPAPMVACITHAQRKYHTLRTNRPQCTACRGPRQGRK